MDDGQASGEVAAIQSVAEKVGLVVVGYPHQVKIAIGVHIPPGDVSQTKGSSRYVLNTKIAQAIVDIDLQWVVRFANGEVEVAIAFHVAPGGGGAVAHIGGLPAQAGGGIKQELTVYIFIDPVVEVAGGGKVEIAVGVIVAPGEARDGCACRRLPDQLQRPVLVLIEM